MLITENKLESLCFIGVSASQKPKHFASTVYTNELDCVNSFIKKNPKKTLTWWVFKDDNV